ncbi:MAG TPA: putative O-glycosylation ligase, exosortase A system-associated, partial [Casimicrobiaceae bacterium]|nr:putative O-glycosylation ligase, exosortase A system-associated [Casimicrobiaceae bacterium]
SLMNPHRLAWGPAFNFPFAAIVAGTTLLGLVLTRDRRSLPMTPPVIMLMVFVVWMCVTSVFAIYPNLIGEMFSRVMKIQLMVLVTLALVHTRKQLLIFLWIVVLSIGFYGLKGGFFTLRGGGTNLVWGPAGSFIEGNNELALAIIIIIPMLFYLRGLLRNALLRWGIVLAMVFCALGALGSHSRGALLAIAAMCLQLWLRSRRKFVSGIALVAIGMTLVAFMPEGWDRRMETIETYQQDSSAMGRINAWMMAYHLAKDRPLGGGFEVTTPELFARYAPVPTDIHAAHSIYFEVLGEHGFLGLAIYLLFWIATWRSASWVAKNAARSEQTRWAVDLAKMSQVSLFGFFVGGAFLSLAYFDLPYDVMIVVVVCRRIVEMHVKADVKAEEKARLPRPRDAGAALVND